jgi:hypothetical protein
MKLADPFSSRLILAAAVLLAVLALAYQVAVRQPTPVATAGPPTQPAPWAAATDTAVARAPAPPPECPPQAEVVTGGSPAARRPWVVRRYVGTVGGQAATALLKWQNPDSATGRFYLHRGGPGYELSFGDAKPGLVAVYEEQGEQSELDQGTWQLTTSLASSTLAGTWRRAGRSQRLLLRESYAGALRYLFKEYFLLGDLRVPENCDYVPTTTHYLLTLPSPRAAPAVLRTRLAGSPAALRRRIRKDYNNSDGDATGSYVDDVRLNDFQLFSYQTSSYVRAYGGTPDEGTESWLFDLRTGQELDIDSQLKPGYERALQRRLTWHFLHDPDPGVAAARTAGLGDWTDDEGRPSALLNLPNFTGALTLTGSGLEAAYSRSMQVLVPYRELRPLVRSGTPLARMLRARGLW